MTGRPRNADRLTPHVDAWVGRLRAHLDAHPGAQSDLARWMGATDTRTVRNWVSLFSKWFRRKTLPDLEHYFQVEAWLSGQAPARRGRKSVRVRSVAT